MHDPGLAAYAKDQDAYEAFLERCRPSLRVVTMPMPLSPEQECSGAYLCDCEACIGERVRLMKRKHHRQPWERAA